MGTKISEINSNFDHESKKAKQEINELSKRLENLDQ